MSEASLMPTEEYEIERSNMVDPTVDDIGSKIRI
jgi:hypothetical protein